jgi:hypothetical protein
MFKLVPKFVKNQEIFFMLVISCILSSVLTSISGAGRSIHPSLGFLFGLIGCISQLFLCAYCLARIFGPLPRGEITCTQNVQTQNSSNNVSKII